MDEKSYKTIGAGGALNIVVGTIAIVTGVACGVLLIINGAKLLASRSKMII